MAVVLFLLRSWRVLSMHLNTASPLSRSLSSGLPVMPQPLSRVAPSASVIISNAYDRVLTRHPELAVVAIEAIASWSNVESFMLDMFVQLMGGPNDRAATAYLALETQSAKTQAIRAVAESVLSSENYELLAAILAIAKSCQKSRNRLAHYVWGDSPELPDALLLADPKSLLSLPLHPDRIFVYTLRDFEEIIRANDRLCGYGGTFRHIIRDADALNREGLLYDMLCAAPEIQERLSRQA